MINIATIEQYIAEQGRFCLLDWLLNNNVVLYSDYEAWRYGKQHFFTDKLQIETTMLVSSLEDTNKHCLSLGLVAEPQEFLSWNNEQKKPLAANKNQTYHQQLTQIWLRPQDQPQLDLFMDNSAQLAETGLLQLLTSRQFEACQQQLQLLSELNPQCTRLGAYQDLINYGMHMLTTPSISNEALTAERQGLKEEVVPLAQNVLGQAARDYLSFAWRRLANNMSKQSFNTEQPELHESAALLEIPDFSAVVTLLLNDSTVYHEAILLERLSISFEALQQFEKSLIIGCLMMELDMSFAEKAIEHKKTSKLYQLWLDFWEENDEWSSELFPAYLLLKNPALIHSLHEFPALKHSATCTMINLLQLRLCGESEIEMRAQLKLASPDMLKTYLSLNH